MLLLERDRVGIEPRRQARRRTTSVLRSRLVLLATGILLVVVVGVVVGGHEFVALTGQSQSPAVLGFLAGVGVACVPWAIWTAVTLVDGSWSWRVGALAERWTTEELVKLGTGWEFDHNLVFYDGPYETRRFVTDIDCIATGPSGVLAVSTKWTSDDMNLADPEQPWVVAAARQAAKNADRLARILRATVPHVIVRPVVVYWGPQLDLIPDGHTVLTLKGVSVTVVSGGQSSAWLRFFAEGEVLAPGEVAAVHEVVKARVNAFEGMAHSTRDAVARAKRTKRRSALFSWAATCLGGLGVAGLIAAETSRAGLRAFDSVVSLGGGAGGTVYLLLPLVIPGSAAQAARVASRRCERARISPPGRWRFWMAAGAAVAWVLALTLVSLFG